MLHVMRFACFGDFELFRVLRSVNNPCRSVGDSLGCRPRVSLSSFKVGPGFSKQDIA